MQVKEKKQIVYLSTSQLVSMSGFKVTGELFRLSNMLYPRDTTPSQSIISWFKI